jgi:nucleoid-associated protein YgaU
LSDSTIGIKVADGSFYPVLEQGFRGSKRLVLTTAKDNQRKVQIDLYRGNGSTLSAARYVGSLLIDNIPRAAQGEPEIELIMGIDADGQLSAEASDPRTGESQRFAASLTTTPESEVSPGAGFEEPPLTGETYPGEEERTEEKRARKGPNMLLLVAFVVLGVLLVAAIAYFVYRSIQGPEVPALPAASTPAAAEPAAQPTPAATEPAPAPAKTETTYLIKKGDTLWDISSTYYRNPWLYPKLAKANSIRDPDLIFAGTRIVIPQD